MIMRAKLLSQPTTWRPSPEEALWLAALLLIPTGFGLGAFALSIALASALGGTQ